jgi:hypothetical protein
MDPQIKDSAIGTIQNLELHIKGCVDLKGCRIKYQNAKPSYGGIGRK